MFDKKKNWVRILLVIILIGAVSIIYVNNVITINRVAKDKLKLEDNLIKIKEQNLILQKQINDLESPQNIIGKALKELGMIYPQKPSKKY